MGEPWEITARGWGVVNGAASLVTTAQVNLLFLRTNQGSIVQQPFWGRARSCQDQKQKGDEIP